jgi:glycosyltransferase involved in cell wall biosynthesis
VALDARLADVSPGGIARYSLLLAAALRRQAPELRLSLLRAARPKLAAERVDEVPVIRALTPPHHPLEQLTLPLELLRSRPDLVHSTDFIVPTRRRWRAVATVHDLGFLRFPETLTPDSRRYYGQIGATVRSADRIIAPSEATRQDLLELVGADPSRIRVVHEAADPRFSPVTDQATLDAACQRLGVSRPFILFVGSFEPRKNLTRLLEAFSAVRRKADVELALVGRRGWRYEPIFARLTELGLEPHVRVHEAFQPADLPAFYSAAAVLAFPSLYEGFGLPPLEAMACGCPVVASDRASLPEIIDTAGLQVPADDSVALAEALLRVLTEPTTRETLVQRGFARAASFSWDRAARETLAVYAEALA